MDETLNGGAKEGLPWIHVTSHPYSDFLTPPSLFSSPRSLSCLTFLVSSTPPHQMPEHESGAMHWVMSNLYLSPSLSTSLFPYPSICPVSWIRRPGRNPRPVRGPLCLSVCQRLGTGCRLGVGSGPGSACLIEVPGGEKRGHPPTSWSQKQKVLFMRLILRRPDLWAVDMNGIYERKKKKDNTDILHSWIFCLLMYC